MKKIFFIFTLILVIPLTNLNAQRIGKLAPEKEPEIYPNNAWGIDIMFGESGFGFGTFYRYQITDMWTAFADLSFAEAKDDREIEYIDYFGQTFVIGKKNRVFQLPLVLGLQYRLFKGDIADNLRPYLSAGAGPTLVITTPYEEEFFSAFGNAQSKFALGGYVGIGANFGIDKSSLVGLSVRYFRVQFFDDGVESLFGRFKDNLSGFFIALNLGLMY
ncbi:MAG: outer membrane beta-barrel protein [Ignavibacterium sp.]